MRRKELLYLFLWRSRDEEEHSTQSSTQQRRMSARRQTVIWNSDITRDWKKGHLHSIPSSAVDSVLVKGTGCPTIFQPHILQQCFISYVILLLTIWCGCTCIKANQDQIYTYINPMKERRTEMRKKTFALKPILKTYMLTLGQQWTRSRLDQPSCCCTIYIFVMSCFRFLTDLEFSVSLSLSLPDSASCGHWTWFRK